jgi:Tol biopolymer transport system component
MKSSLKVAVTCLIALVITLSAVMPLVLLPKPSPTSSALISGPTLREILSGRGNYLDPSVSKDGSRIAFASNRTGNYQIWMVNVDGSHLTKLTDSLGAKSDPQWSPDSMTIAFLSSTDSLSSLWTIKADGSGLTLITGNVQSVQDFVWSPKGGFLTFDSFSNGRWAIYEARAGSQQIQLTNVSSNSLYPSWSADGKSMAYSSNRFGNYDIFVRNVASGAETRLNGSEGDNLVPRFSKSADQLLFMSNRTGTWSIWTEDMNGSALANLLDPYQEFRDPMWSPAVDLSANPIWNPSSQSVLFVSSDTPSLSDAFIIQPNVLVRADEVGTQALGVIQTRISANLTGANSACWTPSGEGVVLTSNQGKDQGIWLVEFNPTTPSNPYGQ